MKTATITFLSLLAISLGIWALIEQARPEAVVTPVGRDLAVDAVAGNVRIFSAQELVLKSQVQGRVASTLVPPNSGPVAVSEGEVIVQLDTRAVERELDGIAIRLQAARERAATGSAFEAQIADAEATLALQSDLVARNQFPSAEHQKLKRHRDSLLQQKQQEAINRQETIALLEQEEAKLRQQLEEHYAIRTPFDGYVTHIYAPVGDLVMNGTWAARVISRERIVEVSLSEEGFAGVAVGQPVTVRLLAQGNRLYQGVVQVVLAEADPESRRHAIYVNLDAPPEVLVPGTTGQASITKAERPGAMVIPRRALLGNTVFVVEDGVVQTRRVEPGFLSLHHAEILSGLDEGELVIVETPHLFRAGERVHVSRQGDR